MSNLREMIRNTWDSMLGRLAIFAGVFGWVPFTLLTMAHNALKH